MKTISVRETAIVLVLNKAEARAVSVWLARKAGCIKPKTVSSAEIKLTQAISEAMGEK